MSTVLESVKALAGKLDEFEGDYEKRLKEQADRIAKIAETDEERKGVMEKMQQELDSFKTLRDDVEKFTRQLQVQESDDRFKADPSYKGFFPNRKMAGDFGHMLLAIAKQDGDHAKHLVDKGYRFRDTKGRWMNGDDVVKAMSIGTGSAGGVLTPDLLVAQLIRNVEMYGAFRRDAMVVPMSQSKQTWPKFAGGPTVYYPDEGVAVTASDLTLGSVTLDATRWSVLTVFSKELEEDAVIGLGELIASEMARALAKAEDTNGFMGDGSGSFAGVTGVFNSANVAVVTMPSTKDSFDDITYQDVVKLHRAVPPGVRKSGNAKYYASPDVAGKLENVLDLNGRPMFTRAREGGPLRALGFAVEEVDVLPGTADDGASTKFLAFGSLRQWGYLGQRRSMKIERSNELKWAEEQVAVKASPRQTIKEVDGNAMAVLRTAA